MTSDDRNPPGGSDPYDDEPIWAGRADDRDPAAGAGDAGRHRRSAVGTTQQPPRPGPVSPGRRRRRGRRILIACCLIVLVLIGGAAITLYGASQHLAGQVHRIPNVFNTKSLPPSSRPTVPAASKTAVTFLLVGSDSRSGQPTTGSAASGSLTVGGQRSDALMLVRIGPDRKSAVVVSIPRDTWVDVPGHGKAKINAAYSYGGPTLAIQTVENLTHVRIDHFAAIDFAGFKSMTDALGGVDVKVAATTTSDGVTFHQGINHLDGSQALTYVRQRHELSRGDLDRVQRQQEVLRAIMTQTISSGTLSNPLKLYHVLSAITKSVSVDDTMSNGDLRSLALSLRGLRGSGVTFMTPPISGSGVVDRQDVLFLDPAAAPQLWSAINNGKVSQYLQQHNADTLPDAPG